MSKTLIGYTPNKNIKLFDYITSNGCTLKFPFRVGDIVKVNNWGCSYSQYKSAFLFFTGKCDVPYYSNFLNWEDGEELRKNASDFKIIGVVEHSQSNRDILAYIRDRIGRGQVIGIEGLELVKQFPLRIGEKPIIKLEKLKS